MSTSGILVIIGNKDECECKQDELDDSDENEQSCDEEKKIVNNIASEDVDELTDTLNVQEEVPGEEKDAEKNKSNEEENAIKSLENTPLNTAKKRKRTRKLLKVIHIIT